MQKPPSLYKYQSTLLLVGILLIALNLRPSLASIGPLVDDIMDSTGLSTSMLGLLTTLPLLAFGVVSIFASFFTVKWGTSQVLLVAMALLTAGILIRSSPWLPGLFIGTIMLGIAIAFGNVLLPTLTKQNFSKKSGLVTSLYSSTMAIGASLAAGISVPLAHTYQLGWRGSLRIWGILAFIALLIWLPQLWRLKQEPAKANYLQALRNMLKQGLAWHIAFFLGLQSFIFYAVLTWLPTLFISRGYDSEYGGWMLSLSQATGIFGSLLIPYLAGKKKDQRAIVLFLVSLEIISFTGLLFPSWGIEWVWISMLGFVLGGSFGLALLFLVIRAKNAKTATELSGMTQSIGYFIAALGPIIIGSLYDYTGDWTYPIITLLLITVLKLISGLQAAKEGTVS